MIAETIKNMLTILVVMHSLKIGSAINCFQCNSNNNSACVNLEMIGKNPLYPTPCLGDFEGNEPFCRKVVLRILDSRMKYEPRVIRSCGWLQHKNPCYNADNEDHTERVCQCFEDGCNTAGKLFRSSNYYYVLLSLLASTLTIRLFS